MHVRYWFQDTNLVSGSHPETYPLPEVGEEVAVTTQAGTRSQLLNPIGADRGVYKVFKRSRLISGLAGGIMVVDIYLTLP